MNSTRILLAAFAAIPALASLAPVAVAKTAAHSPYLRPVVPFIENDYERALARARAQKKPLFIDAWAPW